MLATPYFQLRFESVASTQDLARERFDDLPLLVIAASQTRGRGRSGSEWSNADRSLAVSLIFTHDGDDTRPFSLMAGVAAVRATKGTRLKWPNDVLIDDAKVAGILVETADESTVIGLGLNLWWDEVPPGMAGLYDADPGDSTHAAIGARWGAELMELIDDEGWPIDAYRESCATLGRHVTWDPDGAGKATDINPDGALSVVGDSGEELIYSGAVKHVRG